MRDDGDVQLLPPALVDRLPQRWWAVGNLDLVPWTSVTWHFCVAPDRRGVSVRSIEVSGRGVAVGRKLFDFDAAERDGLDLARRQDARDDRRFGKAE
jgi:hypothetical protein